MPPITPDKQFYPITPFLTENENFNMHKNSMGLNIILLMSKKPWIKNTCFIIFTAFILSTYGYCTFGKILIKDKVNSVVNLVGHASYFMLTLASVMPVCCFSRFKTFYDSIIYFTERSSGLIRRHTKDTFRKDVTLFSLVAMFAIILNGTFLMTVYGWSIYQYYVARDIQFYFFNLIFLTILELAYRIKQLFTGLNESLTAVTNVYFKNSESDADNIQIFTTHNFAQGEIKNKLLHPYRAAKCLELIKCITELHNQLCDLLDAFNSKFGLILVVVILSIEANTLLAITIVIEYSIRHVALGGIDISRWVLATNTAWILAIVGQAFLVARIGAGLYYEGRKTGQLCYGLLNKLQFHEENKDELYIKHELKLLAKQTETRNPELSAGGFFQVDYGVLSLIAKNVTAYSIVVIQFLLKEN